MKIDFIQEKTNSETWYSTEVDGIFVSGSVTTDEAEGLDIYEQIVRNNGLMKTKKILLTHTIIRENAEKNKAY